MKDKSRKDAGRNGDRWDAGRNGTNPEDVKRENNQKGKNAKMKDD